MDLEDIGTLTLHGPYWRLRYRGCGHAQEFPRDDALKDAKAAEREVRRHYAKCLTCSAADTSRVA